MAFEEIPYVSGGVIGAVGALCLLFLWNLACAPYRIEHDKVLVLEAENTKLREAAAQETEFRRNTVPFADVAAKALSRVRDTPSHDWFNFNARTPSEELRRMADFITKKHSVYGHIPGTGVEQIIRPETYFFAVNANGDLIARTPDSAEEAAFVDIRVSKDQVAAIIESVIARCKALNGEDAVPDGEGMM